MAHRPIFRCAVAGTGFCKNEKCTLKLWGEPAITNCIKHPGERAAFWVRYEGRKGQRHLDKYGGGDYE